MTGFIVFMDTAKFQLIYEMINKNPGKKFNLLRICFFMTPPLVKGEFYFILCKVCENLNVVKGAAVVVYTYSYG